MTKIIGKVGEKMKKVLFVATVTGHINAFHVPYLKWFHEEGYEVHVASNGEEKIEYCDKHFNIPFERSPFKLKNIKAYKELKNIIDSNKYEIIHCHTPVGGVLARLAARGTRKRGTRVLYTAHGFHFYKGAPIINWLIYYPVEKWLSRYTDTLITINNEDYTIAKKKFKAKNIEFVNGVGVDEKKFNFEMSEEEKHKLRQELGLNDDDYVLISVGELNKNKNQIMQIETMKEVVKSNSKIKLLIVGTGKLKEFYKKKIQEFELNSNVFLLGYRNDIPKLLKISDCLVSTSKREGLPVNVIEGMFVGLPMVLTDCRGNRDLVTEDEMLINLNKVAEFKKAIEICINRKPIEEDACNVDIRGKFKIDVVIEKMEILYRKFMQE